MRAKRVDVDLPTTSYSIHISDSWNNLEDEIGPFLGPKTMVVTDTNLAPLYSSHVISLLEFLGTKTVLSVVDEGETSKSLEIAATLYTKALEANLDRSSSVVALGGGVVGDLAGFVASTYMRGIDFIQIPTTLLAQVDSSVGGKVAVNHPQAKNIIGSFYQPKSVYINIDTLKTLPPRQFSTGMAELIKYGFIWDRDLLLWFESNMENLMSRDPDALSFAIESSCKTKAEIVSIDEKEKGLRAILNFGHTIGHGLESITGFNRFTHGEAVALGMVYESQIAYRLGLIDKDVPELLTLFLRSANLPTSIQGVDIESLIEAMTHDKKNKSGAIVFVLPVGKGQVKIFDDIDLSLIYEVFK